MATLFAAYGFCNWGVVSAWRATSVLTTFLHFAEMVTWRLQSSQSVSATAWIILISTQAAQEMDAWEIIISYVFPTDMGVFIYGTTRTLCWLVIIGTLLLPKVSFEKEVLPDHADKPAWRIYMVGSPAHWCVLLVSACDDFKEAVRFEITQKGHTSRTRNSFKCTPMEYESSHNLVCTAYFWRCSYLGTVYKQSGDSGGSTQHER